MFKRHNQLFTALRVALDVVIVGAAFAGAYALRFGPHLTWPYPELPAPRETLVVGALALVLWPLSLRAMGLYRTQRHRTPIDEVFGVFKATLVASLLLVALTYFVREARYSRGMLALFAPLSFLSISLARAFFKEVLQAIRRRGYNLPSPLLPAPAPPPRQHLQRTAPPPQLL